MDGSVNKTRTNQLLRERQNEIENISSGSDSFLGVFYLVGPLLLSVTLTILLSPIGCFATDILKHKFLAA